LPEDEADKLTRGVYAKPASGEWRNGRPQEQDGGLATTCLDTIMPRPITWLVPGHIPLGKEILLAGDGGHGKSSLTLGLAADVTRGRPALGLHYDNAVQGSVLLISCEDDYADTVVPRLLSAGADLSKIFRVDGIKGRDGKPAPFNLRHFQEMERELERRPD